MASDPDAFGVLASDVVETDITWVIPGYVAAGKLCEMIGDPETVKTTTMLDWCARITQGRGFCDIEIAMGRVAFLSNEDGIADTLKPRLREARGNFQMVRFFLPAFNVKDDTGVDVLTPLVIPDHLYLLEQQIVTEKIVLLVIDPLEAFLPEKTDTHNNASTRRVLAELCAMAERTKCAILSIRHLNKMGSVDRALYRGGGSIAFAAAARISMIIGLDPTQHGVRDDDPQRRYVLATVKNNLWPKEPARAFCKAVDFESIDARHPKGTVHIEWCEGTVLCSADDLVRPQHKQRKSEAVAEAVSFLRDKLREGPMLTVEVEKRAKVLGISDKTLERAREKLKVIATQEPRFSGPWYMSLPTKKGADDEETEQRAKEVYPNGS